ncbi:hypothetical protein [Chamaesiphon sp. GL140_3_metabinner_50]|uniref:hypothetical protein n=1 Tax=Chamaesiphon sp. GL140_3_metabinner_50 TaxID=2970812 RepID=UPI0025D37D2D|nr:hypothetical protein [Chamaesiphon sp. GL140_3_metabinner_50]
MKLEAQLDELAKLGLVLNSGITIEDLLYSLDRSELEQEPFEQLLFLFGSEVEREPWGRRICDRVWNFDTECIVSTGDYVNIVKNLCLLTGKPDYLTDVVDYINVDSTNMTASECWLEYTLGDRQQRWSIEANDDWADMMTITYVMEDLQHDGKQFYSKDNGQAMILFYLDRATADRLGDLCDEDLEPVIPS